MNVAHVPWHEPLWRLVLDARERGRLPQALLLAGARGLGKRTFARQFMATLLCESSPGPCGQCRGCLQSSAGTHPDGLWLSEHGLHCLAADPGRQDGAVPLWTPDRESKRQDIGVAGIRALIERLTLSSHYGQPRIAVIAPADALNASGANMLLKTVEEPPPNAHLVLLAERWRYLPATLRSRCQLLRFAPPVPAVAMDWLRQAFPGEKEDALAVWVRRPLEAGQGLDPEFAERRVRWTGALAKMPAVAKGRWPIMKTQGMQRDEARLGLECWQETTSAWLRQRLGGEPAKHGFPPVPPEFDAPQLSRLYETVTDGLRRLERNVSPALVVESIIIRSAG